MDGIKRVTRRLTFAHHKGGTGKTTSCINVAGWLTKLGQKVLVVDLDPQANATTGLGVALNTIEKSMYDVLTSRAGIAEIILETESGVYLAPGSANLLALENELSAVSQPISLLNEKLQNIGNFFNFILIDSPPGSNLLMMNGIVATKNLIIPLDAGVFGYETLATLKTVITKLEKDFQIGIHIVMAILKVFSPSLLHYNVTKSIHHLANQFFADNGMQNCHIHTIPFSKKIPYAQMQGLPISHYAPFSEASKVYQAIARGILAGSVAS